MDPLPTFSRDAPTPEIFTANLLDHLGAVLLHLGEEHRLMREQWRELSEDNEGVEQPPTQERVPLRMPDTKPAAPSVDAAPPHRRSGFKLPVPSRVHCEDDAESAQLEDCTIPPPQPWGSDAPASFLGEWVDVGRNFYQGSIISFSMGAWQPVALSGGSSLYERTVLSPSHWHLMERIADGTERHYEAKHIPDTNVLTISVPGTKRSWTLTRHSDLKLWPEWGKEDDREQELPAVRATRTMTLNGNYEAATQSWRNPYSRWRVLWDCVAPLLVLIDFVWIPLQAFGPPRHMGVLVMETVGTAYWALDIIASFLTGHFNSEGRLMQDPQAIAVRYVRRSFFVDVALVTLDVIVIVSDFTSLISALETSRALRIGKVYRAVRVMRVVRVFRVMKLKEVQRRFSRFIISESVAITMGIGVNMIMLLIFNHVSACLWFLLGWAHKDNGLSWIDAAEISHATLMTQYLTSVHFCLGQITPAPVNIWPTNQAERAFTVSLILVAILGFSTFISSITASMTRLRAIHYVKFQQWSLLDRFLQQHKISAMLSVRLTQFLEGALARQSVKVEKEDVMFLKLLSDPLSLELHRECYMPTVMPHGFFSSFITEQSRSFGEVCLHAIQPHLFSKQDVLFEGGSLAPCMYFQNSGVLFFQRPDGTKWDVSSPDHSDVNRVAIRWVNAGNWFCEGSLWVRWAHTGRMCAWTESEVLTVDSNKFRRLVSRSRARSLSAQRAKEFVAEQADLVRTHGCVWDIPPELSLCVFEPLTGRDGSIVDDSMVLETLGVKPESEEFDVAEALLHTVYESHATEANRPSLFGSSQMTMSRTSADWLAALQT